MRRKRMICGIGILVILLTSTASGQYLQDGTLPGGPPCPDGQCATGGCSPQQQQPQKWQAPASLARIRSPQRNQPKVKQNRPTIRRQQPAISQKAHPAVCRVYADRRIVVRGRKMMETSIGSGVLIWRGSKRATVLTVHHLFRRKAVKIRVVFPNGEKYEAKQVYSEENPDLGHLTIPRPNIEPMKISEDAPPKRGDIITLCGFAGKTGQYIEVSGPVEGYGSHETPSGKTPNQDLIIEVGAKEGNSGGPMVNSKGELVAITWGTDDRFSHGTYAARIGLFLTSDRFVPPWGSTDRLAPWNAKTEQEKVRASAGAYAPPPIQMVPVAPPTPLRGEIMDTIARTMAQNALNQSTKALDGVADLSKDVAQAHGATTDKADETATGLANLKDGILGNIKGVMFGWLKSWGLTGFLGGGIFGIVGWFIFKRYLAMQLAAVVDKVTDMIPGEWDDKLIDGKVWNAMSRISGQPIPDYANVPGMSPWGNPYPGYQPPPPPVTPPPIPPTPGPSAREVELEAQIAVLKAAKNK